MRLILLGLLLAAPSLVYGDPCDLPAVVNQLRPGAEWALKNNDATTLVWKSTQTIPTQTEIQNAIQSCQSNFQQRQALKAQARIDVKNTSLTPAQRLQALIILMDFDQ